MIKKLFAWLALTAFAVGAGYASGTATSNEKIKNLEIRNEEIQSALDESEANLVEARLALSQKSLALDEKTAILVEKEALISAKDARIAELEDALNNANNGTEITELLNQIQTLQNEKIALQSENTSLQELIAELNAEIARLEEIIAGYEENILVYDRTFANNTPAQINAVSNEIAHNGYTSAEVAEIYGWNLGDIIPITLTSNEVIEMQIIGFNHDTLSSDHTSKAGITLQMVNCLSRPYRMNDTDTNAGGYAASKMKTETLPTLKALLPQDWQDVIKLVDKKSANGGSSNYTETLTLSEYLFLLAEIELFDTTINAQDGTNEGTTYEYWIGKMISDRKKYNDADGDGIVEYEIAWLLRSSSSSKTDRFCNVGGGHCFDSGAAIDRGVSFALCI